MKRNQDTPLLHSLSIIRRVSMRKHTLQQLRREVEKVLRKMYRSTKVSVILGELDLVRRKKASFENDLALLIAKSRKAIIVNKGIDVFCRRRRITPPQASIRGIMGVPCLYRGESCGAIILLSKGRDDSFTNADASVVALLAERLTSEAFCEQAIAQVHKLVEENKRLCLTDTLTNIPNRHFFDLILELEVKKAKGYTRQLSLALITPDWGRTRRMPGSSAQLIHLAKTIKRNIRDTDFIARFGQDEFMVILPEALNESAVNAAERVRKAIERTPFVYRGKKKKVTISVGVVTYPSSAENLEGLLEQSAKALNRAIQLGRNQVVSL
ncbi:MAG: GGDEF domain-containing protein [candidate division WOR-3 bacterium]|nr:MAG: GGDEF domain-containing protein [candidate division WOR-3 bacterium]